MIKHFLESALVIDDVEKEAKPLVEQLEKNDILARHYTPAELKELTVPLKSRRIIFMDLHLREGAGAEEGISMIRDILSVSIETKGTPYGLVVWSKHPGDIAKLTERLEKDKDKGNYQLPIFVVSLNKNPYIEAQNYEGVLDELEKILSGNVSSNFFMYWSKLVESGRNQSITSLYELAHSSYSDLEVNLKHILYKLAVNHTGIPSKHLNGNYRLENDAVKAMADILHYDIINQHNSPFTIFKKGETPLFNGDKIDLYARINAKLFIDAKDLDDKTVIPGNVYLIKDPNSNFLVDAIPAGGVSILIDLTPPCDFSGGNKGAYTRVLGGYILPFSKVPDDPAKHNVKIFHYKEINSISIDPKQESQLLRFDFRSCGTIKEVELLDTQKYQLFFRTKDKLFADILQKCSSYSARLGIPLVK